MKVQELRIGNIVATPNQSLFRIDLFDYVANGIGKFGQISDPKLHPLTWYLQDLKPVLLTPDHLLKMDFENWGEKIINEYEKEIQYVQHNIVGGTSNFKVCLNTSIYGDSFNQCWVVRIDEDSQYVECEFIHQLQNICYLLAGVELSLIGI